MIVSSPSGGGVRSVRVLAQETTHQREPHRRGTSEPAKTAPAQSSPTGTLRVEERNRSSQPREFVWASAPLVLSW